MTVGFFIGYYHWDFDDSYIVYRYVDNIVSGSGWSFNDGEVHNASTSVLHTVLVALVASITRDTPMAAHVIGAFSLFGTGLFLSLIFIDRFGIVLSSVVGGVAIYVLATSSTWGLETKLFVFLVTAFVYFESRNWDSWILLGLVVLTRPDGIALVTIKIAAEFWKTRSFPVFGIAKVLVVLAPWAVYSFVRFDQLFPDTLGQKIWQGHSGFWGSGYIYAAGFVAHLKGLGLPAIVGAVPAAIAAIYILLTRHPLAYVLGLAALQQFSYAVLNVPPYHWYFVLFDFVFFVFAVFGFGLILADSKMITALSRQPLARAGEYAIAVGVVIAALYYSVVDFSKEKLDWRTEAYRQVGAFINERAAPGPIAALEVGVIGFYVDRKVIDLVGLTSTEGEFLTGARNDKFFDLAPAAIVLHIPTPPMEDAIFSDERFYQRYELANLQSYENYGQVAVFFRKSHQDSGQRTINDAQTPLRPTGSSSGGALAIGNDFVEFRVTSPDPWIEFQLENNVIEGSHPKLKLDITAKVELKNKRNFIIGRVFWASRDEPFRQENSCPFQLKAGHQIASIKLRGPNCVQGNAPLTVARVRIDPVEVFDPEQQPFIVEISRATLALE